MSADPILLRADGATDELAWLAKEADEVAQRWGADGHSPDVDEALRLARELGWRLPLPGHGETLRLWESLATLGAADLTVARVAEPHLDALAILAEAERLDAGQVDAQDWQHDALWGVYAAEGPGGRLRATLTEAGRWELTGPKPWCSLADRVTHALVTAWVDEESRGLFLVDLADPGVRLPSERVPWVARGLAQVRSTGLQLERVAAVPVGEPGWYLQRPGFLWGGLGVAAIWYGGAVGVARRVLAAAQAREPDQVGLVLLGELDAALTRARAVLVEAARLVDGPEPTAGTSWRTYLRVRQTVAATVEEVLRLAGHALGPGPMTTEESHARRVADLAVYVRQHHAERDSAALGAAVLEEPTQGEWTWR